VTANHVGRTSMKYAAELFGTFVLVMGGVGAAVLGGSQIGNLGLALAFGLSLLAMVYTIGPISGCHVNPAVTFGALLSGRIRVKQAVGYMLAQIVGAIVAAAIVLFIASGGPNGYNAGAGGLAANGYGVHSPGHYSLLAAFAAEIVLFNYICDHCAWRHRREIASRVCRLGDRIDAYVSAPCRHSGHKHVSESSPQHRASPLGRRMGFASDMVVYCHSIDWRCYCRCYLQGS